MATTGENITSLSLVVFSGIIFVNLPKISKNYISRK